MSKTKIENKSKEQVQFYAIIKSIQESLVLAPGAIVVIENFEYTPGIRILERRSVLVISEAKEEDLKYLYFVPTPEQIENIEILHKIYGQNAESELDNRVSEFMNDSIKETIEKKPIEKEKNQQFIRDEKTIKAIKEANKYVKPKSKKSKKQKEYEKRMKKEKKDKLVAITKELKAENRKEEL